MRCVIGPSPIAGTVASPPSKSMTHRALVLAALADGDSVIRNPLKSDDTHATSEVLARLGTMIEESEIWRINGGDLKAHKQPLYCGESATTMRLMTAISALAIGESHLIGGLSLSKRPIGPLIDALRQLGVNCSSNGGYPPVTVWGKGIIEGGDAKITGHVSSQFISALLVVAPLALKQVVVEVTTPLESKPYVSMTLDAMKLFGVEVNASSDLQRFKIPNDAYKPSDVTIEGDWSSSAFLIAAGALNGEVTVNGLTIGSSQADTAILDILKLMGAEVTLSRFGVEASCSSLKGLTYNLSDCPDLFPIVSVLCSLAKGKSHLTGLSRLRLKESDRLVAMTEGLSSMGTVVKINEDSAYFNGGRLKGAEIDSHGDHRIAMAFAVAALSASGETVIKDAESVSKSYPGFWGELERLGSEVKMLE